MAFSLGKRFCVLAILAICISISSCKIGDAYEGFPAAYVGGYGAGKGSEDYPETGVGGHDAGKPSEDVPVGEDDDGIRSEDDPEIGNGANDPAQIVSKALLCFNDKYIYKSCEESCRLTVSGNLNVPPDYTDEFCEGPCLHETHRVLDCIDGILSHFVFYNKATVRDVRDTIHAGCGFGPERGHFDVAEHLQAGEDSARKAATSVFFGLCLMVVGHALLF